MSKRIFVLGSTGSIGKSSIEVIKHLQNLDSKDEWQVVGIAAGTNASLLADQANELEVTATAISQGEVPSVAHGYEGKDSAVELIRNHALPGDLVIAAIVGFAGVEPVLAAIEAGCDIALANKEALVAAGEVVISAAIQSGVRILPVDSEHSAIFQCLGGTSMKGVKRIVLTASGGSLRNSSIDEINRATVSDVLDHPTWQMGPKVTVDSASLMNKTLEIIEAHWLFGATSEQIEAVIHPQSIVHGIVEFDDGLMSAQLAPPDMKMPIQFAISWPERRDGGHKCCHWEALKSLNFEPLDRTRFPAVDLAWQVIAEGGTSGAILSAANEVAVEAFLEYSLPFRSIVGIVQRTLDLVQVVPASNMDAVKAADREARCVATESVAAIAGKKIV
ncbi:MAG: 1-deoxy-D-xylulose-5-phosphate reductoisomerase [Phycisphaerales bacterium]|jgi:1-deoxy-D-xylulose-5-phosphate reductoisomerase|nr:1-deoxy-D-xylulose-5-phosphate reductoisomerase [Phycisphaerales bacterium]